MRLVLLLCMILVACADHPDPPQPQGKLIPVNPASMPDYHGNKLYPGLVRAAP